MSRLPALVVGTLQTNVHQSRYRQAISEALHDIDLARIDRFVALKRTEQSKSSASALYASAIERMDRKIEAAEYWKEREAYLREKQQLLVERQPITHGEMNPLYLLMRI